MEKNKKKKISEAMLFILLFGIVSLFSDMTHEGASSIRGAYLALIGASAGTVGFISGLGELIGYSKRLLFGKITAIIAVSVTAQLAAIPLYIASAKKKAE